MKYVQRVVPGKKLKLDDVDADAQGGFRGKDDPRVQVELKERIERLAHYQERLFAEQQRSLLVVLQAMDTAGKDGVLRHVVGPLDSRGVEVVSFKAPNSEEIAHDFLWRVHNKAPRKGQITFFNRSHYEDVLVTRVMKLVPKSVWHARYAHINAFEDMLADSGIQVLKLFLHISRDEQKRRLEERLSDPEKHWKFDEADLVARARWDDYMKAYADALSACSTRRAPWYIVPANQKWYRNLAIAYVLEKTLEEMDPKFPKREGFDPKKYVIPD
jgi:PPK2 family polyphosphate:nucleotide phosphotransferase